MIKNKKVQVEQFVNKLKQIGGKSMKRERYERAMAAVAVAGHILYEYNQSYTDTDLEHMIERIADAEKIHFQKKLDDFRADSNTVLFYDGFGFDTRGVAIMYLNALKKNGYRIIYVTDALSRGALEETAKQMQDADIIWEYIPMRTSYTLWVETLTEVICRNSPKAMFFYTKPNDVAGAVSFCLMKDKVDRYLIDLTDHAFWLGTCCNDFFCGSREMSASNQYFKRNISKNKLIKLGVNLIIDEGTDHSGLPFDVEKERYIFSGGALYKTLGDGRNIYYRIVDYILGKHEDIKFLYAGFGDDSQMQQVLKKYPDRAYLVAERKDFYYLIKNCTLYLNTYPMFGGMMMKYAANAGRIPVTLRHNADSDGLLLNQKKAGIEYDTYEELVEDVDKLLRDPEYLKERETLLQGTVITESRFVNNVRSLIEEHCTDYEHEFIEIDTFEFQKEFFERFDLQTQKKAVVLKINRSLFNAMPWMYLIAIWKIINKIKDKIGK